MTATVGGRDWELSGEMGAMERLRMMVAVVGGEGGGNERVGHGAWRERRSRSGCNALWLKHCSGCFYGSDLFY